MFQEHFPKDVNFDTFKIPFFKLAICQETQINSNFAILEIPAYLIVSDRIKTFSDEGTLEQSFDVWLIPAIKKIKKFLSMKFLFIISSLFYLKNFRVIWIISIGELKTNSIVYTRSKVFTLRTR